MGPFIYGISTAKKNEAEIGFELYPSYQGKGYMSEATLLILNFAFNNLKLKKVIGYTHSKNNKSIQLLTKFGFKLTKIEGSQAIYTLKKLNIFS